MQQQSIEALERAYTSLMNVAIDLYTEVDYAVETGNYNEASLLQSQAEKVFQLAENLEVLLSENQEQ